MTRDGWPHTFRIRSMESGVTRVVKEAEQCLAEVYGSDRVT